MPFFVVLTIFNMIMFRRIIEIYPLIITIISIAYVCITV